MPQRYGKAAFLELSRHETGLEGSCGALRGASGTLVPVWWPEWEHSGGAKAWLPKDLFVQERKASVPPSRGVCGWGVKLRFVRVVTHPPIDDAFALYFG